MYISTTSMLGILVNPPPPLASEEAAEIVKKNTEKIDVIINDTCDSFLGLSKEYRGGAMFVLSRALDCREFVNIDRRQNLK